MLLILDNIVILKELKSNPMKIKSAIYFLVIMALFVIIASSCQKDSTSSSTKKDPIITWTSPTDISFGVLLSTSQLNATANVAGTFVYTPTIGTKLNVGVNQDLKVDFTPKDAATYNDVSKTVKINVTAQILVTDIDGNLYHSVIIGTQTWMVENLKVIRLNDGTIIPNITDNISWSNLTTPRYCWYYNNPASKYGALYNWATVNTGKLAPTGWHVPSDKDWDLLIRYVGGVGMAGDRLREAGTNNWINNSTSTNNITGFTALPGGYRTDTGIFTDINYYSIFWTSVETSSSQAWYENIISYGEVLRSRSNKQSGLSVRCIKD